MAPASTARPMARSMPASGVTVASTTAIESRISASSPRIAACPSRHRSRSLRPRTRGRAGKTDGEGASEKLVFRRGVYTIILSYTSEPLYAHEHRDRRQANGGGPKAFRSRHQETDGGGGVAPDGQIAQAAGS